MANNKFVVKNGAETPNIDFVSPNKLNKITVDMLDSDTLSVSGNSGQLFSITDSLTGTIFAVNDISGVPSIEVDDTGEIRLAETFGNVLVGTATDTGEKLQVNGTISATNLKLSGFIDANGSVGTNGQTLRSDGQKAYWSTEVGFTGSKGDKGDTGFTGSQGVVGFTGSKGDNGTSLVIIGSVDNVLIDPPGDPQQLLNSVFQSAVSGNAVVDSLTGNLWVYDGFIWSDVGRIVGPKGDIGYTGSQGETGFAGSTGPTGYVGSQGYTGSRGVFGYTGSQGIIGLTGSIGPIGYTGSQGIIGLTGSIGPIGFTGSQGFFGYTGSQGFAGYTGSHGEIGFTGSRGDIGYTGSRVYVSVTTVPPNIPENGDLWWDSELAKLFIFYDDGTSTQWVETSPNYLINTGPSQYYLNGYLTINGDLNVEGSLYETSDENLKSNIRTIENSLDVIKMVRGVTFDWKRTRKHSMGLIAQEVEKVLPYLVQQEQDGNRSINYTAIIGLLVESVKELCKIVEDHDDRLSKFSK